MLVAVRDRGKAAETFARVLDARPAREAASAHLAARATVLALGESEIELWQPEGTGPTQAFLERWGEGLLAAGYSCGRLDTLAERLAQRGVALVREGDRLYVPGETTGGLPMAISPAAARSGTGAVRFFYEATHAFDGDWRPVAARYAELFALDAARFSPIASERFGYEGTLTLFDPPARLDRVELSQTFAGRPGAMRRFVEKRGGAGLYMCFAEAGDFDALKARLIHAGAQFAARAGDIAAERDGLWVHPRSLHGMLLGVSRASFAWTWSGRPDLVKPAP
ncbi:MAG: VOC family protein [Burkholderiales bacterium]|nr:VOC family protein [Burkholderiales bacterium]